MSYTFSVTSEDESDRTTVTVFFREEGRVQTADDRHPNWSDIIEELYRGLRDDDPNDQTVQDLFDASIAVGTKFEAVSGRVSVAAGRIFFDGDEVHTALADQVLRFMQEGADFKPLVNFWEKISQNPNEHSRENLYDWLQAQGNFTITDDGDLIAYKGLRSDHTSVTAGPAIVDGVQMNGNIPNNVGSVIQMARSKVNHDPNEGCSVGLHAGTWDYASSFGDRGVTAKVQINPIHVVSVPTDCGAAKMRVCEYRVLETTNAPIPTALYGYGEWNGGYGDPDETDEELFDDIEQELDEVDDYGEDDAVSVPTSALRQMLSTIRDSIRKG